MNQDEEEESAPSQFSYELKVSKERVAVLIGKNGSTKKELEELTHTNLSVDSKEGFVVISGTDAISLFTAREIVRAIARGFNPDIAKLLLKPDFSLEILNINDYNSRKSQLERLRGRVIGKEGKARHVIEELTETQICVYGKTVGIIGLPERISLARRAVVSLLSGSQHSNVYKWLEKHRKEMKLRELTEEDLQLREPKKEADVATIPEDIPEDMPEDGPSDEEETDA